MKKSNLGEMFIPHKQAYERRIENWRKAKATKFGWWKDRAKKMAGIKKYHRKNMYRRYLGLYGQKRENAYMNFEK